MKNKNRISKTLFFVIFFVSVSSIMAQIDKYALMSLPSLTTIEMNAVVNPNTGSIVYNSTEGALYYFDGSSWRITSSDNLGNHNATTRLWMDGYEIQGASNNTLINGLEVGEVGHGGTWLGIANRNRATISGYALIQNYAGTTYLNAESGQRISFRIGNTEGATMLYSGNLGIGTSTPEFKLEVSDRMKMGGINAGTWIEAGATDWFLGRENTNFRLWHNGNRLSLTTAGNLWNAGTTTIGNLPVVNSAAYATVTENDGILRKQTWTSIRDWIVGGVPSSADNLGNHEATTFLNMQNNDIIDGSTITAGTSGEGRALINEGNASNAGYLGIHRPDGNRLGYIGWNNTNLNYQAEEGGHSFRSGDLGAGTPVVKMYGDDNRQGGILELANNNAYWGSNLIVSNGFAGSNGKDVLFNVGGQEVGYFAARNGGNGYTGLLYNSSMGSHYFTGGNVRISNLP